MCNYSQNSITGRAGQPYAVESTDPLLYQHKETEKGGLEIQR